MPPELTLPEFHRPVPLGTVGQAGRRLALEATPEECAALAGRLGILDLASLTASLQLLPEEGGSVRVEGRLVARLTQACVVSLDPVGQAVDEEIAFRLLPPGREPQDGPDDIDEIESPDGIADLGEALAELLALALDPYPRAPAAELPAEAGGAVTGGFAALAALRRKG
ncbi:YceD family protein [Paeniroseomonas aquatica]|uniref:YceD family protein n=1 Tax=Paeniroseomonas aquatica TaxID=373043 RepID=A0ABT8A3G8_9PROT|nr:YceD family protein [Paeniroseomonas aquatica]MDN3564259.1 YceD family protein [Paeniroseomonas aquatica]